MNYLGNKPSTRLSQHSNIRADASWRIQFVNLVQQFGRPAYPMSMLKCRKNSNTIVCVFLIQLT